MKNHQERRRCLAGVAFCWTALLLAAGGGVRGDDTLKGSAEETGGAQYPIVVQDTRFFNNQSSSHTGPPLQVSLGNPDHYSRIFYSPREGALATILLDEIQSDDSVLDVGAETGVFALTAARKGARVTALEVSSPRQKPHGRPPTLSPRTLTGTLRHFCSDRCVHFQADQDLAAEIERSARLNGVSDRTLVLTWLASSHNGYATIFGKVLFVPDFTACDLH